MGEGGGAVSTPSTIIIDMDKKCSKCGKEGTLPSGICLACFTKHKLPRILKRMKRERGNANKD